MLGTLELFGGLQRRWVTWTAYQQVCSIWYLISGIQAFDTRMCLYCIRYRGWHQRFYFNVRICLCCIRYRARSRRKNFYICGQSASDWSLLQNSRPISRFLTWISKFWLQYRGWQRASNWSLLRISNPPPNIEPHNKKLGLYRSVLLRYRSYDFDVDVYDLQYRRIFQNWLQYKSTKISISRY